MYILFLPVLLLLLLNASVGLDTERILSYNYEGTRGWTEILVNTPMDYGHEGTKRTDAAQHLVEIKQTGTERQGKGTQYNTRRLKRTSLPPIVKSWTVLQLNTPLNNGYNQPKLYAPPQSISNIFMAFSNYVLIITPTNGLYFQDSPYRPRTELSESTQWNCSSPNARHDMKFSMIVDELPNPNLAVKVSHSQLFKVLQVQSRIGGNKTNIVLEVNGRWTSDRLTWVIQLSNTSIDMRGKLFTTSCRFRWETLPFHIKTKQVNKSHSHKLLV